MGPGPGFGDFEFSFALAADQSHGGVQQAVAQCLGLSGSEGALQAEQPQPAQQVAGDHGGDAPGLVDLIGFRGQMLDTGVLGAADPVLDPGVGAVAGFEEDRLPSGGVGGDQLVAPPVGGLEQGQLGPR
jgi:hypothetical protein